MTLNQKPNTNFYQKYQAFSEEKFRRMTGVTKDQFAKILVLFLDYVDKNWTKRGRPSPFILEDRLLLTFRYLRDYPAFPLVSYTFLGKMNHFCGTWK